MVYLCEWLPIQAAGTGSGLQESAHAPAVAGTGGDEKYLCAEGQAGRLHPVFERARKGMRPYYSLCSRIQTKNREPPL